VRKLFRRLLLGLLVLIIVLPLGAWLALRASLPEMDGQIRLSGLSAPVSVERDDLGTVTVTAQNRIDASRTLGYVHAQERFFEMDLMRRSSAGELAELFGPRALPLDRRARVHRLRALLHEQLASVDPAQRAELDAYTAGVNDGLNALALPAFPYLLLRQKPQPWRDEDTLLVAAAMFFTLTDDANTNELGLLRLDDLLPPAAVAFLTATGGEMDSPLDETRMQWPQPPGPDVLDLRDDDADQDLPAEQGKPGSNSFGVSGALAGGPALIANDMHLGLRAPNLWFRARVVYPDANQGDGYVDVTGVSLPGTPVVIVGSNGQIAWGFTNGYTDAADFIRLKKEGDRYLTPQGWQAIRHVHETLHAAGAPDEDLDVAETEFGPITASDEQGNPLALRWTAALPGAINLGLMQMERMQTVDEAVALAHRVGMPPQNLLVGDREGHIAWTIAGHVLWHPDGVDGSRPLDGTTDTATWQGWLPPEQVPVIKDPASGRIWTANQRIVGGEALAKLGNGGYALGTRADEIREDLFAHDHFAPADMLQIQLDDRARMDDPWFLLLQTTLDQMPSTPQHEALRQALKDWNGKADANSLSYPLVRDFREEVIRRALSGFEALMRKWPGMELPNASQREQIVWRLLSARPMNLLPSNFASWEALLDESVDALAKPLAAGKRWGEINATRIHHPLSSVLPPFLARYLDMPDEPQSGDLGMPRVAAPSFGASERFAVSPGRDSEAYLHMPGGQSGHPLSPYYGAGHEAWLHGDRTPFLPGKAEHRLTFEPAA